MLGPPCRMEAAVQRKVVFPNTVVNSFPADANYRLLNVNWGSMSPTPKNSRNGPVVSQEPGSRRQLLLLSLTYTFSSPNTFGKQ